MKRNNIINLLIIAMFTLFILSNNMLVTFASTEEYANFSAPLDVKYWCHSSYFSKYRYIPQLIDDGKSYSTIHTGIDYVVESQNIYHANVLAIADGVVVRTSNSDSTDGNGTNVVIKHKLENGKIVYSRYSHMLYNSLKVSEGDIVKAGTPLGILGNTGSSTDPHLDLKIQTQNYMPSANHTLSDISDSKLNTKEFHYDEILLRNPNGTFSGEKYYDPDKVLNNGLLGRYVVGYSEGGENIVKKVMNAYRGAIGTGTAGSRTVRTFTVNNSNNFSGELIIDDEPISDYSILMGLGLDKVFNVIKRYAYIMASIFIYVGIISSGIGIILNSSKAEERANAIGGLFTVAIVAFSIGITELIVSLLLELK